MSNDKKDLKKLVSEEYYAEKTVKGRETGRKYCVKTYEISKVDENGDSSKHKEKKMFVKWLN